MPGRYKFYAPFYDALSAEYPIYHSGRVLGIDGLGLKEGMQVVDIGCGTGLNFSLLQKGIGGTGTVVGIDKSSSMLDQARRRARRKGWKNVILIQADAAAISQEEAGERIEAAGGTPSSDAVLATYALSLIPKWEQAWENMKTLCRTGARASIVDMKEPEGAAAVLTPVARLACRLGGADIQAHPWKAIEEECTGLVTASARGGHIQVRSGRVPDRVSEAAADE